VVTVIIIVVLTSLFTIAFTAKIRLDLVAEKESKLDLEAEYQEKLRELYEELFEVNTKLELFTRR